MHLHKILPDQHLNTESKDIMKLTMGLIGTMAALVIGLLTASAKGSYEAQRGEFIRMSSEIILLDRALANYGPETKDARDTLRRMVAGLLDRIDHGRGFQYGQSQNFHPRTGNSVTSRLKHSKSALTSHKRDGCYSQNRERTRFPCHSLWCWFSGSPSSWGASGSIRHTTQPLSLRCFFVHYLFLLPSS